MEELTAILVSPYKHTTPLPDKITSDLLNTCLKSASLSVSSGKRKRKGCIRYNAREELSNEEEDILIETESFTDLSNNINNSEHFDNAHNVNDACATMPSTHGLNLQMLNEDSDRIGIFFC